MADGFTDNLVMCTISTNIDNRKAQYWITNQLFSVSRSNQVSLPTAIIIIIQRRKFPANKFVHIIFIIPPLVCIFFQNGHSFRPPFPSWTCHHNHIIKEQNNSSTKDNTSYNCMYYYKCHVLFSVTVHVHLSYANNQGLALNLLPLQHKLK